MPVAGSTRDITGRRLDFGALQRVEQVQPVTRLRNTVSLNDKGDRITGLQKLVQRYTVVFLTIQGDVKYAPTQGTNFVQNLNRGLIQTNESVLHQFIFANSATTSQLRSDDTNPDMGPTAPDDERIANASLLDFEIDYANARLVLQIAITNLQGETTIFVLPTG
jgi:hypothetical protein